MQTRAVSGERGDRRSAVPQPGTQVTTVLDRTRLPRAQHWNWRKAAISRIRESDLSRELAAKRLGRRRFRLASAAPIRCWRRKHRKSCLARSLVKCTLRGNARITLDLELGGRVGLGEAARVEAILLLLGEERRQGRQRIQHLGQFRHRPVLVTLRHSRKVERVGVKAYNAKSSG